jgi:hypothetical protein
MVMKTVEEAKAHLKDASAFIPSRYVEGVEKATWKDQATKGEDLYAAEMSKVIAEKRRQKGVAKSSDEEWKRGAREKGGAVIGSRISGATDKYAVNFGAVYKEVQATVKTLPPRTADMKSNVMNRLLPVVEAAQKAKKARRGY